MTKGSASDTSRRIGGFIALAMVLTPIAPEMLSGCGSSTSDQTTTRDAAAPTGDATTGNGMVVTGGGSGSDGASSGSDNPFGPPPTTDDSSTGDDGSGSWTDDASSSGATDGAIAPGNPSDSGLDSSDGIPDSGIDAGSTQGPPDASTGGACVNYNPPLCGTTACDLRSNTCCISVSATLQLTGRCVAGANTACKQTEQTAHCQQACECTGGKSCCGIASTITGSVQSVCQAVADGAFCQPHTTDPNPVSAAEQFCKTDGECKNGEACIAQTCAFGAKFSICGLQSQAPFDCR